MHRIIMRIVICVHRCVFVISLLLSDLAFPSSVIAEIQTSCPERLRIPLALFTFLAHADFINIIISCAVIFFFFLSKIVTFGWTYCYRGSLWFEFITPSILFAWLEYKKCITVSIYELLVSTAWMVKWCLTWALIHCSADHLQHDETNTSSWHF